MSTIRINTTLELTKMVLMTLAVTSLIPATPAESSLIISQYAEDGDIKGIELWNSGPTTITFSAQNQLTIGQFNNGSTSATLTVTKSSGTLASGDVLVFADGSENDVWTNSGIAYDEVNWSFNGDDAIEVRLNGVLTDMFGTVGSDPGSAWNGNGVSTADQNLQLIEGGNGITTGATSGFSNPSLRFTTVDSAPLDNGSGGDLFGFGIAPITPVPEPSTLALAGLGIAVAGLAARRRRLASAAKAAA